MCLVINWPYIVWSNLFCAFVFFSCLVCFKQHYLAFHNIFKKMVQKDTECAIFDEMFVLWSFRAVFQCNNKALIIVEYVNKPFKQEGSNFAHLKWWGQQLPKIVNGDRRTYVHSSVRRPRGEYVDVKPNLHSPTTIRPILRSNGDRGDKRGIKRRFCLGFF